MGNEDGRGNGQLMSRYRLWHRAWCRYSFIGARTHVLHAKRISMPETVGQLLVLRRRASENHKPWVIGGCRFSDCTGMAGEGRGEEEDVSACGMHLHLKWLRLPDTPLRNHVMRDFYCFPRYSFLSPRIDDAPIFRETTSDSWLSLGSKISTRLVDRGFRLPLANFPCAL